MRRFRQVAGKRVKRWFRRRPLDRVARRGVREKLASEGGVAEVPAAAVDGHRRLLPTFRRDTLIDGGNSST